MALISILVPVYNVPEQYLKRCLNSLKNQTFSDIEIIIVDDGSEKSCGEMCDKFAQKDSRFTVIHKKNQGLSSARNTAYENSHAQWVMFVDGDDWMELDTCRQMLTYLNQQIDIIVFGIYRDSKKSTCKYQMPYYRKEAYTGEECKELRNKILDYTSCLSTAYAKLYQRDFLDRYCLQHDSELKSGIEGIEFTYRVFDRAKKILILPYYGYHYIFNETSLSARPTEKSNRLILSGVRKIKLYMEENRHEKQALNLLYQRIIYLILATATRSYFNPYCKYKFSQRKQKMLDFLKDDLVEEALNNVDISLYSVKNRVLLKLLIKHRFFLIYIYAILGNMYHHFK